MLNNINSIPLNKSISQTGFCSRRNAVELIRMGRVKVDGLKILEPGYKVTSDNVVRVDDKPLSRSNKLVYILLNKPLHVLSTTKDPSNREIVTDLVRKATKEKIFPIGRLDYDTTGLLILTNDGELTQRLSHPSYEIKKTYLVTLNKPLSKVDFDKILNGTRFEDGIIIPDEIDYPDVNKRSVVRIQIHSGRNRIIRRIFENLGFIVEKLDRVKFANLTTGNLKPGEWRYLTASEIKNLK